MKSLILMMLIGEIASVKPPPKRDISHEIGVYASLRPFSMLDCVIQCEQAPRCNSVLLEIDTKTCFLNRNVSKGSLVSIKGYLYSEKADPTKPQRVQQCITNLMREKEACARDMNTTATTTVASSSTKATATATTKPTTTAKASVSTTAAATGTSKPITTTKASVSTSTTTTTTTEASAVHTSKQPCPDRYVAISNFDPPVCCRIELNPASFSAAESICQNEGSAFILPDSEERLHAISEAIFDAAKGKTSSHMVWLDASRSSYGDTWETTYDGPFDYDSFRKSKWDDNSTNEGNCLGMLFTPPRTMSGWLSTNCSSPAWFVCTPVDDDSSAYP